MALTNSNPSGGSTNRGGFLVFLLCALGILAFLFSPSFDADKAHFANDAPMGVLKSAAISFPGAFSGMWLDLAWLGLGAESAVVNLSSVLLWWLGPVGHAKFLVPVVCLVLGSCAWVFFKQAGFSRWVCILGGIAAMLNMNYLSNACWGLGIRPLTLAAVFLALAALVSPAIKRTWQRAVLAGFCIGLAVAEGFDVGAIFSLYVAAFALFLYLIREGCGVGVRAAKGVGFALALAVCAGVLAFQPVSIVLKTSIFGITNMDGQKKQSDSDEQRWDWATQWSISKAEALRVLVPGLFGYRLDTANGGNYWGRVGQQPGWEEHHQGFPRHNGSGEYAGVLVVLLALWSLVQSFRERKSVFDARERKIIWFWGVMAFISLLFAFGRFAPFYRIIYSLPYFNTIRNPMKFMHPLHMVLMILFAYGLQGMSRLYLDRSLAYAGSLSGQLKQWWANLAGFDKKWALGSFAAIGASFLAWLVYAAAKPALVARIQRAGFGDNEMAQAIAKFSIGEVGWFILFLVISVALVSCVMSGMFSGSRSKWAGLLLGAVLVADLCRANAYWIVYYNYKDKYASNPVVDFLADKSNEHRVTVLPFNFGPAFQNFQQYYHVEWAQHHFQFYNIQSIDIVQMPREPLDYGAYRGMRGGAFSQTNVAVQTRYWELTNTKYLFGPAGVVDSLNQQFDPVKRRFKNVMLFTLVPKADSTVATAEVNKTGPFALIEFTGALPRAGLYANWEVSNDDQATLKKLPDPAFNPHETVLVSGGPGLTLTNAPADTKGKNAGTVEFTSYAPKKMSLKAKVERPAVLMLNDKHDANWKVFVDGHVQPMLRCNFIMRGVQLAPGEHTVEFRFLPESQSLYVTLAAIVFGFGLLAFVVTTGRASESAPADKK